MERDSIYRVGISVHHRKAKKAMENESQNFLIKLGIYIAGVTIGLMAKLALIKKDRELTLWEGIAHAVTAFASAFIVWNVMNHYHAEDWAKNGVAVIVGRYGDAVLLLIWTTFKKVISTKSKDF